MAPARRSSRPITAALAAVVFASLSVIARGQVVADTYQSLAAQPSTCPTSALPAGSYNSTCFNCCWLETGVISCACEYQVLEKQISNPPSWIMPVTLSTGASGVATGGTVLLVTGRMVLRGRAILSYQGERILQRYLSENKWYGRVVRVDKNRGDFPSGRSWRPGGDRRAFDSDAGYFRDLSVEGKAIESSEEGSSVIAESQQMVADSEISFASDAPEEQLDFERNLSDMDALDNSAVVEADAATLEEVTAETALEMSDALLSPIPVVGEIAAVLMILASVIIKLVEVVDRNKVYTGFALTTLNTTMMCAGGNYLYNNNGVLNCDTWAPSAPGGSWTSSCYSAIVNGTLLTAQCATGNYFWGPGGTNVQGDIMIQAQPAVINMALCANPLNITNSVGRLICSPAEGIPQGQWSSFCSPLKLEKGVLTAACPMPSGSPWPMAAAQINLKLCRPGSQLTVVSTSPTPVLTCPPGSFMPPGPWYASCAPWSFEGGVLKAYCGAMYQNGTARLSTFNTSAAGCQQPLNVVNQYSTLACVGNPANLPGGSWISTCSVRSWDQQTGMLYALCGLQAGALSGLNYTLCAPSSGVINSNGVLVCETPSPLLPPGSWTASCAPLKYVPAQGVIVAFCTGVPVSRVVRGISFQAYSIITSKLCAGQQVSSNQGTLVCTNGVSSSALHDTSQSGPPPGSWAQSCGPISWIPRSGSLKALCGTWNFPSLLMYSLCAPGATVSNNKGVLVCSAVKSTMPPGSWSQSCTPVFVFLTVMAAQCEANQWTYLNTTLCTTSSSVYYADNRLNCNSQLPAAGAPGGSWTSTCTLTSFNPHTGRLQARCGKVNNEMNYTLCAGGSQLTNIASTLVCNTISSALPGAPGAYSSHGGSWYQSCTPQAWNGTTLTAACGVTAPLRPSSPDGVQRQVPSTINAVLCGSKGVSVVDNQLACEDPGAGVPSGSYLASCTDLSWDATTQMLGASCAPSYSPVLLNITFCATGSTISNNQGVLICEQYASGKLPGGSWTGSCGAVTYDTAGTGYLVAYCAASYPVLTFMSPGVCEDGVANFDGYLDCAA